MFDAIRGLLDSATEALSVWAYETKRNIENQSEIDYGEGFADGVESERNKDD